MTALQKVAWLEVIVSLSAVLAVSLIAIWNAEAAIGGFGLLGFLACAGFFLRRRSHEVIVDERDRMIEQQAQRIGINTAWMLLFITLILIVTLSSLMNRETISIGLLSWVIWLQFAVCYTVKGTASLILYGKQQTNATKS